ncbi:MAG TPA: hypothetical protein VEC02_03520 [Nitrososphaerales archaeon]|nr:hypothetical protein [Nitrososphaerales archaeon]
MSVRVSPISRGAAVLIVIVGLFTMAFVNPIAGVAFVVLGVALYWFLYRFARRVRREVENAGTNSSR